MTRETKVWEYVDKTEIASNSTSPVFEKLLLLKLAPTCNLQDVVVRFSVYGGDQSSKPVHSRIHLIGHVVLPLMECLSPSYMRSGSSSGSKENAKRDEAREERASERSPGSVGSDYSEEMREREETKVKRGETQPMQVTPACHNTRYLIE